MSLFLNALKTLADRPEAGFPPVGGDGSPDNANTSDEQSSTTAGQQMPSASEHSKEKAATSIVEPQTEQSQPISASWSGLWQQALANPTPIEATPDSPEDVALADLAEMAETVKSPHSELPRQPKAAKTQDPVSTSPSSADETQPEAAQGVEPAQTQAEASDETPEPTSTAEMISQEDADEAPAGEEKELQPQENPLYSEEMKYIFAPWFEAHDKEAAAEPIPSESAEQDETTIEETESEAAVLPPETEEVEESDWSVNLSQTEEMTDEPAIEETAEEVESSSAAEIEESVLIAPHEEGEISVSEEQFESAAQTSAQAQDREKEELQDAHANLLAEEEEPGSSAAQDETWELYDRTTDWSETRSSFPKEPPKILDEAEPAAESSLAAEQEPEPVPFEPATSSPADAEVEIPDSPIAAALATFAAEQKQQQAKKQGELAARETFTTAETPAVREQQPAAKVAEILTEQPEPARTILRSQPAADIRVTEPYLRLATRLCQSLGAGRPQAIAITSVDQAAGKALNLAQLARALTLAEEGDVLVVQGSEARPQLAERLGVISGKRPRWAHGGGGDLAEKIICNADGRLAMLPHHALRNSPIQLVDPLLLARCKRHYSLMLVETGDLTSEISQSLIAQADIGLITAVLHATPRERASQAAALLRRLGVRISGCILNEARPAA